MNPLQYAARFSRLLGLWSLLDQFFFAVDVVLPPRLLVLANLEVRLALVQCCFTFLAVLSQATYYA